jgi:hypothetical protein
MQSPGDAVFARRPGSIRRTSHIDMLFVEEGLRLKGAARDLLTLTTADARVAGYAEVDATVGPDGRLVELRTTPDLPGAEALHGLAVRAGFRDALAAALPEEVAAGTPLALLLDDLPVATLISGYALLYGGMLPVSTPGHAPKADICSGWREGGTMMVSIHAGEGVPVTIGPAAPQVVEERAVDPLGWHTIGDLPPGAMRRRRLIDVLAGDELEVTAMFRDTHVDEHGEQTVLHEYALTAGVDPVSGEFTRSAAVPRVLPWVECPVAASSADRLVGVEVGDVRDHVRAHLRGTSTCTHLNDLLRSLGDVGTLAAQLV